MSLICEQYKMYTIKLWALWKTSALPFLSFALCMWMHTSHFWPVSFPWSPRSSQPVSCYLVEDWGLSSKDRKLAIDFPPSCMISWSTAPQSLPVYSYCFAYTGRMLGLRTPEVCKIHRAWDLEVAHAFLCKSFWSPVSRHRTVNLSLLMTRKNTNLAPDEGHEPATLLWAIHKVWALLKLSFSV